MLSKIMGKLRGLKNNYHPDYIKLRTRPVNDRLILLEGGQGTNLNGNMFALLKELKTNPQWNGFSVAFVVTKNNLEKAQKRMETYGFSGVQLLVRNSKAYRKALATAKFLATDNSFPPYFHKQEGQVILNTWHGTPLKNLGKAAGSGFASFANVQKNFLNSDYALFPNEFTRNVFMNDYDLAPIFANRSVIAGYPRNGVFYDPDAGQTVKKALGLAGKQLFAYMPTWRDNQSVDAQIATTKAILSAIDAGLDDNTVLLVNLHFVLSKAVDCESYSHIQYFSPDFETYEILNACDGLITDYSSVFFDFATTGRKIILFGYDKEEYTASRGMYMSMESLPFPLVTTAEELLAELNRPTAPYDAFIQTYCPVGNQHICRQVLAMWLQGNTDLHPTAHTPQPANFVFGGSLTPGFFVGMGELVKQTPNERYIIAYKGSLTPKKKRALAELGQTVTIYGLLNALQLKPMELLLGKFKKLSQKARRREADRLFGGLKPASFIKGAGVSGYWNQIFTGLGCPITRAPWMGKTAHMTFHFPWYIALFKTLVCYSLYTYKTPTPVNMKQVQLMIGEKQFPCHKLGFSYKNHTRHVGLCLFTCSVKQLVTMPSNNPVGFAYQNPQEEWIPSHARYCWLPIEQTFGLRSVMAKDKATNTVAVFRQMKNNYLNIYVRSANVSDKLWYRAKQVAAWITARLWHTKKAKSLVLLYEKNGAKYEESASVLFEELIHAGYQNAYFIVDKHYEFLDRVPQECRPNLLYKHTFRHYLYFFKAKTFMGTEAVAHAIDLKTFNLLPLLKIVSKSINYVFLQHGVMYMVSLDSEAREVFAPKKMLGHYKYRVITSSPEEAHHFVTLGGYKKEDLYVCGLPKFDRNIRRPDADKIVIMPTWRPWEINQAREDFTATAYYQMMMAIYDAIPTELQEKVVILPHPLIVNELGKLPAGVAKKMVVSARYDDVLQQTALLITDYSSIAYDAFYRGANVLFYWEQKDECMAHYGPSTRLMLNVDNVYGDVAMCPADITKLVTQNYQTPQTERHVNNYQQIVSFHDGQNTRRLIELLQKDRLI